MSVRPWWLLPPGRIHPGWWVALGALLLWLDHVAGSNVPVLYVLPVILAAWYIGKMGSCRVGIRRADFSHPESGLVVEPRAGSHLANPGHTVSGCRRAAHRTLVRPAGRLRARAQAPGSGIEGLLPICAFCKSIRNESGKWENLESYISRRSEAEFSHGVCPSCGAAHYPGMLDAEESVTHH